MHLLRYVTDKTSTSTMYVVKNESNLPLYVDRHRMEPESCMVVDKETYLSLCMNYDGISLVEKIEYEQ